MRARGAWVQTLISAGPLFLAALLAPAPARAGNELGIVVGPVESVGGAICVTYVVEQPFTPRLEETLLRGMPATVTFEVGLWRRRAFWFDKLVLAIKSEHKVVYDPWAALFRVRSGGTRVKPRSVPSLDSLKTALFSETRLPLISTAALDSMAGYYVSVRTTIRPLSPEDLGEVEDWLSGEARGPSGPPRGVPGYLLGIAVNLSGLGDRTALAKSETFKPSLLGAPPAPNPIGLTPTARPTWFPGAAPSVEAGPSEGAGSPVAGSLETGSPGAGRPEASCTSRRPARPCPDRTRVPWRIA